MYLIPILKIDGFVSNSIKAVQIYEYGELFVLIIRNHKILYGQMSKSAIEFFFFFWKLNLNFLLNPKFYI